MTAYTQALEVIDQAGKSDPVTTAAIHEDRGWAYLLWSAPVPALADFDEALTAPRPTATVGRAEALVTTGAWADGVADADAALARGPASGRLCFNAARVYGMAAAQQERSVRIGFSGTQVSDLADFVRKGLDALADAIALVPEADRPEFWQSRVIEDTAFDIFRENPRYRELARTCLRPNKSASPR